MASSSFIAYASLGIRGAHPLESVTGEPVQRAIGLRDDGCCANATQAVRDLPDDRPGAQGSHPHPLPRRAPKHHRHGARRDEVQRIGLRPLLDEPVARGRTHFFEERQQALGRHVPERIVVRFGSARPDPASKATRASSLAGQRRLLLVALLRLAPRVVRRPGDTGRTVDQTRPRVWSGRWLRTRRKRAAHRLADQERAIRSGRCHHSPNVVHPLARVRAPRSHGLESPVPRLSITTSRLAKSATRRRKLLSSGCSRMRSTFDIQPAT